MMKNLFVLLSLCCCLFASEPNEALYKSLDPKSISQHFAFYELYPNTPLGHAALKHAWKLLDQSPKDEDFSFPKFDLSSLISLITQSDSSHIKLSKNHLEFIEKISKHLANRRLTTYKKPSIEDFIAAQTEEIDLGRAVLLTSLQAEEEIASYEAMLDLMALQIKAHLPMEASDLEKIYAINDFIFYQMRFRFPPTANHEQEIDTYTFLPSVLDKRRGVCLGVSILYLCLAQRLDVPLEAVTPPGHIYVRYKKPDGEYLNIETTARGIHIDTEEYLGIEIKSLPSRSIKEVVGMAYFNQASVHIGKKEFDKVIALYKKALQFMPNDFLTSQLLAYNYLFNGNRREGEKLLKELRAHTPENTITSDATSEDYLLKRIDAKGIQALFMPVDENRTSIIEKQKELKKILAKHPKFRSGLFHLAGMYIQIHRYKEALDTLEQYFAIDQENPIINYYLSMLYYQRFDYVNSWKHFLIMKRILNEKKHLPKFIAEYEKELKKTFLQPS